MLRAIEPIAAEEMYRVEGSLPRYLKAEAAIAELAEAEGRTHQRFLETLDGSSRITRSQPGWKAEGCPQVRTAALAKAGWLYGKGHLPL